MAEKMLMLALSPTMEEGTIVSWHKKEGDPVASGDVICEVETDKATMDYESMQEGTLLKILVPEGGNAAVEEPIAIIGEKGEDFAALLEDIQNETSKSEKKGDSGEDDRNRTEKASSPDAGQKPSDGQAPPAGTPARSDGAPPAEAQQGGASEVESRRSGEEDRIKASPLARSMAAEAGIDLRDLRGSGPEGRIIKRDLHGLSEPGQGVAAAGENGGLKRTEGTTESVGGLFSSGIEERRIPLSRKRRLIARRLSESKFSAPHYYLKSSVSMSSLMITREKLNGERAKQGLPKLSLNAFLVKFAAEALKRHPVVNSGWEEEHIHIFGSIDIGLAVALEDGLITPVVRNCGAKGVSRIDEELQNLIARAREGKLNPEEYTGASFSISNLGSYGIEDFTAIINPPASAILAVASVEKVPVVLEDNSISLDNRMKLSLSCDHRVIDGAVGAEFLRDLKLIIEDPLRALI
jgi:pyruvate dehydrogenase E2 component (dihydrolipoamide acetyltransferase)